ncbi:MAG: ATP-binding protein [Acidimicrobiia bacterium]
MTGPRPFPFSAVVGQDDAKLALQLAAVDPRIGGVLLRGEKGSAKTTLARGLAALLPGNSPFVELPLGATEDRLIGTLDLAAALTGGDLEFKPGLLAAAHGGVLYVDEVNLLADHLVDALLDVAASGVNVVEREGVSHRHDARFVLIGSMNPEEGELRPQLLDRFGLCVEITAPVELAGRVDAVRRRLAFDRGTAVPGWADAEEDDLARRLAAAHSAEQSEELQVAAARVALAAGAEGLRADLTLCRAAAAHAGLDGRATTTFDDLRRVAPLVLSHRARRAPFDTPTLPQDALDDALDDALAGRNRTEAPVDADDPRDDRHAPAVGALGLGPERHPPPVGRARVESSRGRFVRDIPARDAPDAPVAAVASVRTLARRRALDPTSDASPDDVRAAVREDRAARLLVLTVDLSGSMGAPKRADAASGSVLGLLTLAYQQRDQVALVGFRRQSAEVLLSPTTSVEVARNRLGSLETGGETPLAEGISTALTLATTPRSSADPLLVLLTDGRATGTPDAARRALAAAAAVRAGGVAGLVLDCELGTPRLGLAARVADAMGAPCVPVPTLEPAAICSLIRRTTEVG